MDIPLKYTLYILQTEFTVSVSVPWTVRVIAPQSRRKKKILFSSFFKWIYPGCLYSTYFSSYYRYSLSTHVLFSFKFQSSFQF